ECAALRHTHRASGKAARSTPTPPASMRPKVVGGAQSSDKRHKRNSLSDSPFRLCLLRKNLY
ncbi:MAG: hypothetical protein MN733_02395, partial [Nitrososphaera sp.]|nr:hypothetical protein [Nitrososphaera sp.]